MPLFPNPEIVYPNISSVNTAGTAGTCTTTTYVDIPGTSVTMSFTKRRADTSIVISCGYGGPYQSAGQSTTFGVNINSVDYDYATLNPGALNVRGWAIGTLAPITGLAAGVYTVKQRVKRTSDTTTFDTFCRGSILVMEVAA